MSNRSFKNEFPNPPGSFHNMLTDTLGNLPERENICKKFRIQTFILIAACIGVAATITMAEKRVNRVFQIPKTEMAVSDVISEEYYAARDKQKGMKLYVLAKNNFYIQIPEDAFVSEGVHIDESIDADTCTMRFNNCLLSVAYNYVLSGNQYATLEEVMNAFAEDGITLQGEVKDFETFEITDDIKGYKFYQYVSEKLWIEHIHYYTPDGEVGIVVQAYNTNSEDEVILSKSLNSILIK